MYIRTFLLHFTFCLTSLVAVGQTVIKPKQAQATERYFNDRLENLNSELLMKPADFRGKLKSEDIASARQQVWELWKSVNQKKEGLPAYTPGAKDAHYPVHHWELYKEDPLPFYFVGKAAEPDKKNPLFIQLHGSGPKEDEFKAILSWSLYYKDWPSLYFIPQIPNEKRYRWWLQPVQLAWEKLFRLAMLRDDIDPDKLYMLGISEGGYGSQRLGAFYADYLAGAGPMAGGEPLENAPPLNYRHVAFSLQTGALDKGFGRNELTGKAKTVFDSLAMSYPGDFVHQIDLQEGKGHGIDYTVTTPWLSKYKRRVNPEEYSWVWFPMDGRYRKGFYNIGMVESPIDSTDEKEFDRVLFNVRTDRNENTVYLTAERMTPDEKQHKKITKGVVSVYLSPEMLDLTKRVQIVYNGKRVYRGKVRLSEATLAESCALFGDPARLFPAKVEVNLISYP